MAMQMIKVPVLVFILVGLAACGTIKVPMEVTHPAEINMAPYKQIAIGEIKGNMGQAFSAELKNKLVESERFEVVDRSRMDQIMSELKLSQSDLTEEKNRVKLGNLLSASAVLAGHTEGRYKEETSQSRGTCIIDKKERPCTTYYRKGVVNTSGSMDVIDVQTGRIIRSKPLTAAYEKNTSAVNERPAAIDKDTLFAAALNDNVETVIRAIMPWTESVQVPFKKSGKIPDLERGINQARIGNLQKAIKIFSDAAKAAEVNPQIKPEIIAYAYWNLGLAYQYTFVEFDNAKDAFKKAYNLKADQMYIDAIKNVEQLEENKKKLDEQTQAML